MVVTWDGIAVAATIVAAPLAAIAILYSVWQAKKTSESLVRERRIDFELDKLTHLADLVAGPISPTFVREAITRLELLPIEDLPITRAVYDLETTPEGRAFKAAHSLESKGVEARYDAMAALEDGRYLMVRTLLQEEVRTAILSRLAERG